MQRMKKLRGTCGSTVGLRCVAAGAALVAMVGVAAHAQDAPAQEQGSRAPVTLTLKHAIELALQNSKDIQVAKLQASLAEHSALISKSEFLPNIYAGSGAGY